MLRIVNVVATYKTGVTFDLAHLTTKINNAHYTPKMQQIYIKFRDPRCTISVSSKGNLVITGAASVDLARLGFHVALKALHRYNPAVKVVPVSTLEMHVQNFVGTANFKASIHLENMAKTHADRSSYEPEIFPGLTYRFADTPAVPKKKKKPEKITGPVATVFGNGPVNYAGFKSMDHMNECHQKMTELLLPFIISMNVDPPTD
jgi:transcription initiation factor TFIID TATA-box-binding protein